jgi:hypothetical protein
MELMREVCRNTLSKIERASSRANYYQLVKRYLWGVISWLAIEEKT